MLQDGAIVVSTESVDVSTHYKNIIVPNNSKKTINSVSLRVAGYLVTSFFFFTGIKGAQARHLQKLTLRVMPLKECKSAYKHIAGISTPIYDGKNICAGGEEGKTFHN